MVRIPPCEPGLKVQPSLLVVTRRHQMESALATRLRGLPARRCDLCSRLGGEPSPACFEDSLLVIDLLEIMVAPTRFPVALSERDQRGMAVVALRHDERELLAGFNEHLLVHILDLLDEEALARLLDQASPEFPLLFAEMHRISALRVREFLARVRGGEPLTSRETQIMWMLAQGYGTGEILRLLGIRPKTLRNHITSILPKLAASRRAEAVARFLGNHRQPPSPPREGKTSS